jgi:hypothetical protein
MVTTRVNYVGKVGRGAIVALIIQRSVNLAVHKPLLFEGCAIHKLQVHPYV